MLQKKTLKKARNLKENTEKHIDLNQYCLTAGRKKTTGLKKAGANEGNGCSYDSRNRQQVEMTWQGDWKGTEAEVTGDTEEWQWN